MRRKRRKEIVWFGVGLFSPKGWDPAYFYLSSIVCGPPHKGETISGISIRHEPFWEISTGKLEFFSILRGETADVARTTQPRKKWKYVHTEYGVHTTVTSFSLLIRRYVMYVQIELNLHLICSASGILDFLPFFCFLSPCQLVPSDSADLSFSF